MKEILPPRFRNEKQASLAEAKSNLDKWIGMLTPDMIKYYKLAVALGQEDSFASALIVTAVGAFELHYSPAQVAQMLYTAADEEAIKK